MVQDWGGRLLLGAASGSGLPQNPLGHAPSSLPQRPRRQCGWRRRRRPRRFGRSSSRNADDDWRNSGLKPSSAGLPWRSGRGRSLRKTRYVLGRPNRVHTDPQVCIDVCPLVVYVVEKYIHTSTHVPMCSVPRQSLLHPPPWPCPRVSMQLRWLPHVFVTGPRLWSTYGDVCLGTILLPSHG